MSRRNQEESLFLSAAHVLVFHISCPACQLFLEILLPAVGFEFSALLSFFSKQLFRIMPIYAAEDFQVPPSFDLGEALLVSLSLPILEDTTPCSPPIGHNVSIAEVDTPFSLTEALMFRPLFFLPKTPGDFFFRPSEMRCFYPLCQHIFDILFG